MKRPAGPPAMARPAGPLAMKRPAGGSSPCRFVLADERTRKTWRARVDATSKGFTFGPGKQYPSDKKAREAARKYLDDEIAKKGHRAKFPEDGSSIVL